MTGIPTENCEHSSGITQLTSAPTNNVHNLPLTSISLVSGHFPVIKFRRKYINISDGNISLFPPTMSQKKSDLINRSQWQHIQMYWEWNQLTHSMVSFLKTLNLFLTMNFSVSFLADIIM